MWDKIAHALAFMLCNLSCRVWMHLERPLTFEWAHDHVYNYMPADLYSKVCV